MGGGGLGSVNLSADSTVQSLPKTTCRHFYYLLIYVSIELKESECGKISVKRMHVCIIVIMKTTMYYCFHFAVVPLPKPYKPKKLIFRGMRVNFFTSRHISYFRYGVYVHTKEEKKSKQRNFKSIVKSMRRIENEPKHKSRTESYNYITLMYILVRIGFFSSIFQSSSLYIFSFNGE